MFDVFQADGTWVGSMGEVASARYVAENVGAYRQYFGESFPGSCELGECEGTPWALRPPAERGRPA